MKSIPHLAGVFAAVASLVTMDVAIADKHQEVGISAEDRARLLAQVEPRFKAIYETDEFRTRSFQATWLPDGSGYLKMETPAGATVPEVVRYDAADGTRTVVVPRVKLIVPGGSQPVKLNWFQRAPQSPTPDRR